ncbi:hypothetical protein GCM10022402_13410 [Salinactinospora qingdaonensis]|uniref:Polyketide synthase-like phosphopantetheine-binding domain-containing protein n=2 Tax=Salinactinospora qingdaonensis TaxID=702744 RepID=A0ABP7FBQ7_9ACTN
MAPSTPLLEQVRGWLVRRVAYYAQCGAAEIDVEVPLAEYGLESVYTFSLCGDIADHFELAIDPTLIWDLTTVATLAHYLAAVLVQRRELGDTLGGKGLFR